MGPAVPDRLSVSRSNVWLILPARSRSRARHYAPSLRSLAAGWPLAGHYAAPQSPRSCRGRGHAARPRTAPLHREMPHGRPRSAAAHARRLEVGFAGCRHSALRRQFCSEGRRHLIKTSYARPAGPINVGLGRAAPGLPGRPYIPAFIFFFFGDYGHQNRKNLTGGTRLIKNPPRLAIRSPWRAFLLIICRPRKRGNTANGNKEGPGQ